MADESANIPDESTRAISQLLSAPLVKLCEDVLATLAQRPGRIYEGSHEDITPLAPLSKMLKDLAGNASKLVEASVTQAIEEIKMDRP